MFDIGSGELLLILIVVLIAFGPRKLPELAQSLGRGIREFKKAQREFTDQINTAIQHEERKQSRATAAPPVESTVGRGPFAAVVAPMESHESIGALGQELHPHAADEVHTIAPPHIPASQGAQTVPSAPLPPDDATIGQISPTAADHLDGRQLGFFHEGGEAKSPA